MDEVFALFYGSPPPLAVLAMFLMGQSAVLGDICALMIWVTFLH